MRTARENPSLLEKEAWRAAAFPLLLSSSSSFKKKQLPIVEEEEEEEEKRGERPITHFSSATCASPTNIGIARVALTLGGDTSGS